MKKRLFSWILAVVMILTTVTVIPFTASAAGAEYAADEEAVDAGYVFKVDGLYYNSIFEAAVAVAEGGTIYVVGDYTHTANSNNNTTMIGAGGSNTGAAPKTYTIKGLNDAVITVNPGNTYGMDFFGSNVTLEDLSIVATRDNHVTLMRVSGGSTLHLKNCEVIVKAIQYGVIASYNANVIVEDTTITAQGTGSTGNKYFFHLQNRNSDAYWSGTSPASAVQTTSNITFKGTNALNAGVAGFSILNGNGANVTIYPGTTANANVSATNAPAATVQYESGDFDSLDDDEKIELKAFAKLLGVTVGSYDNDAAAVADGQAYRIGTEGVGKYYPTLSAAVNAAENGATIYLLKDLTISDQQVINPATIKAVTIDAQNHTITGTTVQYNLDFYNSAYVIRNLTFTTGTGLNQMPIRVFERALLTFIDSDITIKRPSWGGIGVYGNLTLNNTTVTIDKNGGNSAAALRIQMDSSRNYNPTVTLQEGAALVGLNGQSAIGVYDNTAGANKAYLVIDSGNISVTGAVGAFAKVTFNGPTAEDLADAEKTAAWKAVYTKFGGTWNYDPVAKVGETEYTSLADAVAAVPEGGTLTLLDDTGTGLVANNGKTFTIDGAGHSIACSSGPSLTVDAGTTVTVTNITLNSTGYRNTVAMNGGTLNVGDKATIINTDYNSGNSVGNAIRGTAADSGVVNVYDGATITAGTGAFVFDTGCPGSINIYGGTITSSFYVILFSGAAVKVNISGGTITNDNKNNAVQGIFRCYNAGAGHSVNITGGELHFSGNSLVTNGGDGAAMATPAFVTIGGTAVITNDKTEATLNVAAALATLSENAADVVAAGTALRLPTEARDGNSGVAFGSQIDRDAYNALVAGGYTVKTGTVILPTDLIPEETALTLEALTAAKANFLKIENSGWYNAEEEEDFYLWYGSIVNLKETNFDREFTGFGYVELVYAVDTIGSIAFSFSGDAQTAVASELAAATLRGELNDAQTFMLDLYSGLVD